MKKLIFAFMITLAIILLILGFQQEQKDIEHLQSVKNSNEKISDYVFDVYIPKQIKEGKILSDSVKSDIIEVFNKNYPNKEILKKELTDVISARIENSFAMSSIGEIVAGKTLNNITGDKSDNNDLIITIRNPETSDYVISVDLSYNCATDDRVRVEKVEKKNQFAKQLFSTAFNDYTKKGREVTFWSFLEPSKMYPWYEDVKNMESTDLEDLKEYFIKYNCELDSLKSFELLVSSRIYEKEDYFGTPVIKGGTFTNQDMTIIITSGQNLLDQLELDNSDRIIIKQMEDSKKSELEKYTLYKLQSQIFMFIVSLVFILLFLYVSDHKNKP